MIKSFAQLKMGPLPIVGTGETDEQMKQVKTMEQLEQSEQMEQVKQMDQVETMDHLEQPEHMDQMRQVGNSSRKQIALVLAFIFLSITSNKRFVRVHVP